MTTAPRRAAAARPAPPRATTKSKPARGTASGRLSGRRARWVRVALLVLAVLLGLPLAHAMWGEVVALLGGAVLLGFWLGRWTAP